MSHRQTHERERRLHLVDIENLIGSARPSRHDLFASRDAYEAQVPVGPHDHVVVACNHGLGLEAGLAWAGCRLRLRSGADGADLALLDVIETERAAERFGMVVVGSGDGIFAEAVSRLVSTGVGVLVVSRPVALSRRLRLAAGGKVVPLHPLGAPAGPAAARIEAA